MKRVLKTYYADVPNMGDLLNELLIRNVFGYDLERHKPATAELSVIGSGMDCFLADTHVYPKYWSLWQEFRAKFTKGPMNVWCTGFISNDQSDSHGFYRDMNFCSVRGKLTKARVEKIIGKTLDIPVGDGGLITPYLFDKPIEKKYAVGIIPHFKEQQEPIFQKIKESHANSFIINLRDDPMEVIRQIAQSDIIISSSLHGLILADSFGIPNQWIKVTDNLKGDGFKFDDYYSAFDLKSNPINSNTQEIPSINQIIDNFKITPAMMAAKQKEVFDAFPFK